MASAKEPTPDAPAVPEVVAAAPDEGPAQNVVQAIARVMRDVPAVGKDQQMGQGGGDRGGPTYKFRGIEQVLAATQRTCGKHGVVITPHVTWRDRVTFTLNSKPWTDDLIAVEYEVYGPGGIEDRLPRPLGPIYGVGRDNADKGFNKAESQAFKYALCELFQISTGDRDEEPDGEHHENDGSKAPEDLTPDEWAHAMGWESIEAFRAARDLLAAAAAFHLTDDERAAFKERFPWKETNSADAVGAAGKWVVDSIAAHTAGDTAEAPTLPVQPVEDTAAPETPDVPSEPPADPAAPPADALASIIADVQAMTKQEVVSSLVAARQPTSGSDPTLRQRLAQFRYVTKYPSAAAPA